jgi:hypothetical protein
VSARPVGGGATLDLAVRPDGLVQEVQVPAGRYTLTFSYHPPGLDVGLGASALGLGLLGVAGVVWLVGRRRRRRSPGSPLEATNPTRQSS